MQPVDPLPAAPAANSPGRADLPPATGSEAGELFHAVMGRALAQPSSNTEEDSDPAERFPSRDLKAAKMKEPDAAIADPLNPAACLDSPAARAAPLPSGKSSAGASLDSASPAPEAEAAGGAQGQPAVAAAASAAPDAVAKSSLNLALFAGSGQSSADPKSGAPNAPDAPVPIQPGVRNEDASASLPADEASGGISGAEYALAMKKAEKANEFSGSTQQNLPGVAAQAVNRPARAVYSAAHFDKSEALVASAISNTSSPTENTAAATTATQELSPARSLERVHDMILSHAYRLRDSGDDALQVVIKPGSGLQLSLHLQMREGVIEMQASVQRGNYEFLNLHWPELQQHLDARGVRLAALEHGDPAAAGDRDLSRQPGRDESREPSEATGTIAGFAFNNTLVATPSVKARPALPRGWESWA